MKCSLKLMLLALAVSLMAGAQTRPGTLKGKVTDKITGESIPYANVVLQQNGEMVASTTTDINGNYTIIPIIPGKYTVLCSFIGYSTFKITGVTIAADKPRILNFQLSIESEMLQEVVVTESQPNYSVGATKQVVTAEEVKNLPYRNVGKTRVRGARTTSAQQDYDTEEYDQISENGYKKPTSEPLSTFSIDVDGAAYANIRRHLKAGALPPVDAVRVEECINYFSYAYPEPNGKDPFSITTELAVSPWSKEHYLLHIGLKGITKPTEELPRNNLVFLLDVSGSMQAANKLDLVKKSLKMLINQLNEDDHIAIVVYAGASGLALPSTKVANKQRILETLEALQAGGSTAGAEGIQLAYEVAGENFLKNGNNRIILCTDGDFNVGISSQSDLVKLIEDKRDEGIFLSVFGFGMGNLKDSKMEQIANHGNGTYNYIDNLNEAQKVFVNEAGSTLLTIAKDVKIQVEFNPEHVAAYRLIGYENRLLNAEDFNNDKKDAGEIGAGHTVTAIYEIVPIGAPMPEGFDIDPLKYQKPERKEASLNDEIATVKFRYKEPNGSTSKLISVVVQNNPKPFDVASVDTRFSAAVASWAMLLRNSPFKGTTSYEQIITWGLAGRGTDEFGYRAEFIQLVRLSKELDTRNFSSRD
jgi:Ca-activated chloride channel family protein